MDLWGSHGKLLTCNLIRKSIGSVGLYISHTFGGLDVRPPRWHQCRMHPMCTIRTSPEKTATACGGGPPIHTKIINQSPIQYWLASQNGPAPPVPKTKQNEISYNSHENHWNSDQQRASKQNKGKLVAQIHQWRSNKIQPIPSSSLSDEMSAGASQLPCFHSVHIIHFSHQKIYFKKKNLKTCSIL